MSTRLQFACLSRYLFVCLAVLSFVGCAGAPVQEMSDARQAIRAAQEAGAARTAGEPLAEAQTLLARAESFLNKRFFRSARRNAEEARTKALEALQTVQTEKNTPEKQ